MTDLDFIRNVNYQQALKNPILDIGARFLGEEEYNAFKICYMSLRVMDDLVDDRKIGGGNVSNHEIRKITKQIDQWLGALENRTPQDQSQLKVLEVIDKYHLPIWPWKKFARSMIYDLDHDGFRTFRDFLRYCEGAAIAPGAIYMHVCMENETRSSSLDTSSREAARPLAIFSYLVHIIRDFQLDQNNKMNYFAEEVIERCGASVQMLRNAAAGVKFEPEFRGLMKTYYDFSDYYRQKARAELDKLGPSLKPRYQLSLDIVYSLYNQIFEKIDIQHGTFTAEELLPSSEEVLHRINVTIESFVSRYQSSG